MNVRRQNGQCLIVGGGPAGLATALFLSVRGIQPRIIDKNEGVSTYSKALGVNPRTLELLEPLGLTEMFLRSGRKMECINVWHNHRVVFRNQLSAVNHRYPFMLIQPQRESELLLTEALAQRGIQVERRTELDRLQQEGSQSLVELKLPNGLADEARYDTVVGADGAHSRVREQLGIAYEGFQYQEAWELYDIVLEMPLHPDEGHILISREGGVIMIRLQENVWRVAGNIKPLLDCLPPGTKVGDVVWQSTFTIHHQLARRLHQGNSALIGDAAHLHSPVGARGMNLGIEDAFVLSTLMAEHRMHDFTRLRRPYLKKTVRRINAMTQTLAGHHVLSRKLREHIGYLRFVFPVVAPSMRRFVMGLNT